MGKNVVFMTCMEKAPDFLDYKEWCYKTWQYWCHKNDVEMFILDEELRPTGGGVYGDGVGMKPTWQRWHVWDVLEANDIDADNVALVDVDACDDSSSSKSSTSSSSSSVISSVVQQLKIHVFNIKHFLCSITYI